MNKHNYEYTDTFSGDANYSWVKRGSVSMPELTNFGYDGGTNYSKANRVYNRELVKRVKAELGLTGVLCARFEYGDTIELRPYGSATVLFISYDDNV